MRKLVTGRRPFFAVLVIAIIAGVALAQAPDGKLHVWFLDVGQGDAIFVQTPEGRQILIDGGPSPSALAAELGAVMPFWDRSFDLVIMTHPDADHAAGLIPLFDRLAVDAALDALAPTDPRGAAWLDATAGIARRSVARGARIEAGQTALTVLNPAAVPIGADTRNDDSLVLRLEYGATSLLLTGDAEAEAEQDMLASGVVLRSDALKVGHHGSNAGTSPEFLAAVQPRLAVISVGADNRFGHPAPDLLARLAGLQILRTDLQGRIELISDGRTWTAHVRR